MERCRTGITCAKWSCCDAGGTRNSPSWRICSGLRSGLQRALAELDAGRVHLLIVAKLDRLSGSVIHGSQVIDRARRCGWGLVALDFGLDTSTPTGEMVASVVPPASQYERRMIGLRTKDALAAKKAAGVRLGRPRALPLETVWWIVDSGRAAPRSGRSLRTCRSPAHRRLAADTAGMRAP
jgi:DNA invertase Pin-like site-specific DNA recombinase